MWVLVLVESSGVQREVSHQSSTSAYPLPGMPLAMHDPQDADLCTGYLVHDHIREAAHRGLANSAADHRVAAREAPDRREVVVQRGNELVAEPRNLYVVPCTGAAHLLAGQIRDDQMKAHRRDLLFRRFFTSSQV